MFHVYLRLFKRNQEDENRFSKLIARKLKCQKTSLPRSLWGQLSRNVWLIWSINGLVRKLRIDRAPVCRNASTGIPGIRSSVPNRTHWSGPIRTSDRHKALPGARSVPLSGEVIEIVPVSSGV